MSIESIPSTRLRGNGLHVIRLVFAMLVTAMLVVGIASFGVYFARDGRQVCTGTDVECQVQFQYSIAQVNDFERHGVALGTMLAFRFSTLALGALVSLVIGLFVAARRSDDWMAMLMALLLISFGTVSNQGVTSALTRAVPALVVIVTPLGWMNTVLMVLVLGLFPNGRPAPPWMRRLLPLVCLFVVLVTLLPNEIPAWLVLLLGIGLVTCFGMLLWAQLIRYRRYATLLERQQTKWAVVGAVLFLLTYMTSILLFSLNVLSGNPLLKVIVGAVGFNLLPELFLSVFLGVAILRSRLWDIDLIIRRTLIYSIITAMLALFYLGSVIVLQQILRPFIGQESDLAIIVSILAIAALFNPLRHRVQDTIDRRFYRRKYDAQKVLERFAVTVRDEVELEKLTGELMNVVGETMQPASVSLWLKKTDGEQAQWTSLSSVADRPV